MGFPFYKQQSLLKYGKLKKTPNFYLFCEFAYIFKTKKFMKKGSQMGLKDGKRKPDGIEGWKKGSQMGLKYGKKW